MGDIEKHLSAFFNSEVPVGHKQASVYLSFLGVNSLCGEVIADRELHTRAIIDSGRFTMSNFEMVVSFGTIPFEVHDKL